VSAFRRLAGVGAALLCLAACDRSPEFVVAPAPDALQQTFWKLPDFSLTERSGQPVTLADLAGKVWVADFFYSSCPGPCPMLSSRLSDVQKQVGHDPRVRLVSISTDPKKDTPEVLRSYAERFHANERWLFLTGPKAAVLDLARDGFKLPFAEDPNAADPITHSTRLILVDQTGAIRGLYEGVGGEGIDRLVADIQRLLAAKP
jgi:protein SCO1/2